MKAGDRLGRCDQAVVEVRSRVVDAAVDEADVQADGGAPLRIQGRGSAVRLDARLPGRVRAGMVRRDTGR